MSKSTIEMGKRIRQRRLQLGIAQRQLAIKIGMDPSNLGKVENGKNVDLTATMLRRLAFHLQTTVDWIVGPLSLDEVQGELAAAIV